MDSSTVSPAYQQIVDWYQHWQSVEMAKPIPLLVTTGAPNEGANQVQATDSQAQTLDVFA